MACWRGENQLQVKKVLEYRATNFELTPSVFCATFIFITSTQLLLFITITIIVSTLSPAFRLHPQHKNLLHQVIDYGSGEVISSIEPERQTSYLSCVQVIRHHDHDV